MSKHARKTRPLVASSTVFTTNKNNFKMSDDGGEHVADQYDDANRAFLQSFMARGTLTLKEGQELLAAIFRVQEGLLRIHLKNYAKLIGSQEDQMQRKMLPKPI